MSHTSRRAARNHGTNFDAVVVGQALVSRNKFTISHDEHCLSIEVESCQQIDDGYRSLDLEIPSWVMQSYLHLHIIAGLGVKLLGAFRETFGLAV
jgi:hypothetical protein